MLLDPLPVLVPDPAVPVRLEDTLSILALDDVMVALSLSDGVDERLLGNPSLEDEPRAEVDTSLLAISKDAIGSEGRGGRSRLECGGREGKGRLERVTLNLVGESV
jgi:hypothetical protein